MKIINPVLYEVRNAVKSLDSVLTTITSVFDAHTKSNIRSMVQNLNLATASFVVTSASLQKMMDPRDGVLARTLNNVNTFTENLNTNNGKLDSILENTRKFSENLSRTDLKKTLDTLQAVVNNFKETSGKLNSKEGSIGLLLNDKTLYQNLESTTRKINILLDDIRVHPKRYVNFSVFGKKDKGNYITTPLIDDSLKMASQ
jgi:phospholipid/cholesterol/gamma-HCH transport system substrate-binding protein